MIKKCKLCNKEFDKSELTKEHYPAKSLGNYDLVRINLLDVLDDIIKTPGKFSYIAKSGQGFSEVERYYSNSDMGKSVYPEGRYAITLCRKCNSFLGKYDEAYKKFYDNDGDPRMIKGFSKPTKLKIIKAIYGKFLSVPESSNENFDFREFILDEKCEDYNGDWKLYFVKRDIKSDLLFRDINIAKLQYDDGVVYHLSDNKFIFDLLNFDKPKEYVMNNIFDILDKNYNLVVGTGECGGLHGEVLIINYLRETTKK